MTFEIPPQARGETMTDKKTGLEAIAKAALQATFTLTIVDAYQGGLTDSRCNVFVTGRTEAIK